MNADVRQPKIRHRRCSLIPFFAIQASLPGVFFLAPVLTAVWTLYAAQFVLVFGTVTASIPVPSGRIPDNGTITTLSTTGGPSILQHLECWRPRGGGPGGVASDVAKMARPHASFLLFLLVRGSCDCVKFMSGPAWWSISGFHANIRTRGASSNAHIQHGIFSHSTWDLVL
jgi:hypothetical protein